MDTREIRETRLTEHNPVKGVVEVLEQMGQIQGVMADTESKVVGAIRFLQSVVTFLLFTTGILLWRVFLWEPLNTLLQNFVQGWRGLSEGYQILILSIIGALIAGVVSQVIGSLLYDKLKRMQR
ncbi:MAG: hypothetical protein KBD24_03760 [Candidatus Pacebacteria bacterium]|nr:hypothetical protein [Candidatus Paceibacterota bacterium]